MQSCNKKSRKSFSATNRNHSTTRAVYTKATETSKENGDKYFQELEQRNEEETHEETQLRALWESNPFKTSTAFVQSVVANPEVESAPSPRRWLIPIDVCDGEDVAIYLPPIPQEYQRLFARAFVEPTNVNDEPTASTGSSATDNLIFDSKQEEYKGYYSFRLDIAYMGEAFCGWQTQPNNKERPSVQQTLEDCLQPMFQPSRRRKKYAERADQDQCANPNNDRKEERKRREPRVNIRVAGRTDAGVHAIGQVARFRTWTKGGGESTFQWNDIGLTTQRNSVNPSTQLQDYINQHPLAGKVFRCLSVTPGSSKFHPTFGASGRAYLYLIDAASVQQMLKTRAATSSLPPISLGQLIQRLNGMLGTLEKQDLDYVAMSYGKVKTQSTLCNLHIARALCVNLVDEEMHGVSCALCIQLVGNRFLRRMVRILVSTALRESLVCDPLERDEHCDYTKSLLNILQTKDRRLSARPAPPQGLIFCGASFDP